MEYSGFFNGNYKYGQEEFSRYFENIYENGVSFKDKDKLAPYEKDQMTLKVTNDGLRLKVAPGFAIVKGYYLYNKEEKVLDIAKPTEGKRIDRVVVRLNSTVGSSSMSVELKSGTNVKEPDLTRSDNIYELSLAKVIISADGSIIVEDERAYDGLCGGIRPKNVSAYENMIAKIDEAFNKWLSEEQNKGREIYIQSDKPKESVSGSIWIDISAV
ncbi:hypothetical protein [Clostridium sp. HBUAS56017]|uniref:hypothetical protein n=1 Tax=Clostridium sp. HBUAS56017 TaxID=2571128 RepID=UPI001177E758|nr:hypothetical protein [Clostridium sp. HBUAS56017]